MIVSIKADIFYNNKNSSDLNDLMHFFKKGKHRMNLRKIDDFNAFENSEWKKTLSRSDVDFLKEGITIVDKKEIIISESQSDNEFRIKEAYSYLQQPLSIVVENYEYEPVFINCIFRNYGNELISAKDRHWLKFENGGGASDNTIKGMIKELFNDSVFTKSKEKYLRCYVIKDSDREYCTINEDGTINVKDLPAAKFGFLEDKQIPYHILYKREKENYMPDSVYNNFLQTAKKSDEKKEFSQIYLKFNAHQKDFFDIEKGFSHKGAVKDRKSLQTEVQKLFEKLKDGKDLTDKEYAVIGLGLPFPSLKSEFSKIFDDVKADDLEKRIQHQPLLQSKVNPADQNERNEFEHIINEIKYLL
jgi:hypothetical protein